MASATPTRTVAFATVTPLASIFGSGLLIIVPILEVTLGALAVVGIAGVCCSRGSSATSCATTSAWSSRWPQAGRLRRGDERLEVASDVAIAIAYIISVALYLRIMAQFLVGYVADDSMVGTERLIAAAAVALIVTIGVTRGFAGLDFLDRIALGAVLVLITVLGFAFLGKDMSALAGNGLDLPPVSTAAWGTRCSCSAGSSSPSRASRPSASSAPITTARRASRRAAGRSSSRRRSTSASSPSPRR